MDDELNAAYDGRMRKRICALAVCFAAWMLLALGRAWYIAVPARDGYMAAGERMARREVTIPASRGSILDADGVELAWSEHFYDLVSTATPRRALSAEEVAALKKILPSLDESGEYLRRNLTPGEVMGLEELIRSGVRVRIVVRHERRVVDSPNVRRRVGGVRRERGITRGEAGWEKEFDRELSGSPGRMSVMLDRNRNWIRSSVKVLKPTRDGSDVGVQWTLRELEQGNGEAADAAR